MPTQPVPNIRRVTQEELRKLFNEQYLGRIDAGEIQARVIRGAERHPSLPAAVEPFCTRSQALSYIDPATNEEVARAHRYLRPDGSIGAS
ncbi:MAG: hypothetical protein ACREP6_10575, partial [Candidatus Binataceae bacterium]